MVGTAPDELVVVVMAVTTDEAAATTEADDDLTVITAAIAAAEDFRAANVGSTSAPVPPPTRLLSIGAGSTLLELCERNQSKMSLRRRDNSLRPEFCRWRGRFRICTSSSLSDLLSWSSPDPEPDFPPVFAAEAAAVDVAAVVMAAADVASADVTSVRFVGSLSNHSAISCCCSRKSVGPDECRWCTA